MDKQTTPEELIRKYNAGTCTEQERAIVESWHLADLRESSSAPDAQLVEEVNARMRNAVLAHAEKGKQVKLWPRIFTVAAAVAAIVFGIWFFSAPRHPEGSAATRDLYANDVAPGKNTAILIVNGKQTQLSDAKAGIVVNDDIKYNDGTKISSSALGMTEGESRALEVITPKGGTYSIILQDGTKVWLNADSKLEVLPNFWNKTQRLVRLTGEAYFEVAKNKARPFRVESQGQQVTVLGTHFNINAYPDEDGIKTTLIEGSVRVTSLSASGGETPEGREVVLKPSQQSTVTANTGITVKQVDITTITDWKNNEFYLDKMEFKLAMRKIARWYNVEIIYNGAVADNLEAGGWVQRNRNLSDVLKAIEATGLAHFKIEGQKVYVTK